MRKAAIALYDAVHGTRGTFAEACLANAAGLWAIIVLLFPVPAADTISLEALAVPDWVLALIGLATLAAHVVGLRNSSRSLRFAACCASMLLWSFLSIRTIAEASAPVPAVGWYLTGCLMAARAMIFVAPFGL